MEHIVKCTRGKMRDSTSVTTQIYPATAKAGSGTVLICLSQPSLYQKTKPNWDILRRWWHYGHALPKERGLVALRAWDWYTLVNTLRTRCDISSSLLWGTRSFPTVPLVKISPAPIEAVSGKVLVCLSQPSLFPKIESGWAILCPKTGVLSPSPRRQRSCIFVSLIQTAI